MKAYYNEMDPFCCQWLRNLMAAGMIMKGDIDERPIQDVKPEDVRGYVRQHYFAGIGGWELALQLADWPKDREIVTGSVPCQPFSCAGKRQGASDERHLWPEFFRLVRRCRPPVIFGEQVASAEVVGTQLEAAFVIAVQNGDYARANKLAKRLAQSRSFHWWARWLDRIQADLAKEDYTFRFKVLGAHSVSASHIRQRVYWVAYTECMLGSGQRDSDQQGQEAEQRGNRPAIGGTVDHERTCRCGNGSNADCWTTGGANPLLSPTGPTKNNPRPRTTGFPDTLPTVQDAGRCGNGGPTKPDGLADPERNGGRINESERGPQGRIADGRFGPWSDYLLIPCRDGKLRRISAQPGDVPLAASVPTKRTDPRLGYLLARLGELGHDPKAARGILRAARRNRVGRLKGYGNAIVPQVAAEFIRACMQGQLSLFKKE